MGKYEQPTLNVIRFEMEEALTTDVVDVMSTVYELGENVDEW